jgi:hypothetical protein
VVSSPELWRADGALGHKLHRVHGPDQAREA